MNIIENDFGLPKVPEDLDKEEFEYRNKYRNIYLKLIVRCQNMTEEELFGYNEKHHIVPKCLGGSNDHGNLLLMPIRYHIVAHLILTKVFPENPKIWYALQCMFTLAKSKRSKEVQKLYSTREVASFREEAVKNISGKRSPLFGKRFSEETREKIRQARLGTKASKETRERENVGL